MAVYLCRCSLYWGFGFLETLATPEGEKSKLGSKASSAELRDGQPVCLKVDGGW